MLSERYRISMPDGQSLIFWCYEDAKDYYDKMDKFFSMHVMGDIERIDYNES